MSSVQVREISQSIHAKGSRNNCINLTKLGRVTENFKRKKISKSPVDNLHICYPKALVTHSYKPSTIRLRVDFAGKIPRYNVVCSIQNHRLFTKQEIS